MIDSLQKNYLHIIEGLVIISIILFLFKFFSPGLIFSPTHISAGDTVGHYYGMYYLNKVLIPNGEIIGWCPNWFLGYPMFQFYFPLLFSIGAVLGYVIALPVAFKIITVLGTFLLPICAFLCFRMMKFEFPVPLIAAIFTVPYLFMEHYSMWGGNIPSTLAGEFAYVFSLSLMLLLFGSLYQGLKEGKHMTRNAVLFAAVTISHVFPAIFAIGASSFFLFDRKNLKRNLIYLFKTFGIGLMLCSFWFIPMLAKSAYTTPHMWYLPNSLEEFWKLIFSSDPGKFFPVLLFSAIGIIGFIIGHGKKDDRAYYLGFSALIAMAGLLASSPLNTLGIPLFRQFQFIKFIPIMYILLFLLAAYTFVIFSRIKGKWLLPIITLIAVLFYVNSGVTYIQYWIEWNYSGYEAKSLWDEYRDANNFLSTLDSGRVVFEYDPDKYDSGLGSSRATETIPAFSGRPITEGTHFQSSFGGPYIYFAHCEYSNGCSCVFGPETGGCTGFDIEAATTHLELFNVRHLFVSSEKLKQALRSDERYKMLYGPGTFEIWELETHDGSYVTLPDYYPVYIQTKEWRNISYEWFREYRYNQIPVVWGRGEEPDENFRYSFETITDISSLPAERITETCFINEDVGREEIKINTNCIGKPLLVKISYFPNWQVEGADKIYLASPAYMMIFPNQENVRIYYGWTWSDVLGLFASLVGFATIILYFYDVRSNGKLRKKIGHLNRFAKNRIYGEYL